MLPNHEADPLREPEDALPAERLETAAAPTDGTSGPGVSDGEFAYAIVPTGKCSGAPSLGAAGAAVIGARAGRSFQHRQMSAGFHFTVAATAEAVRTRALAVRMRLRRFSLSRDTYVLPADCIP